MAKETMVQKKARWAKEEAAREEAKKAFREAMPAKLVSLMGLAKTVGYQTDVELTESGPTVKFSSWNQNDGSFFLTYNTEEWEVESVERKLNELKAEQDAKAARHKLAQDLFNTFTKEQKDALKEHIRYLV